MVLVLNLVKVEHLRERQNSGSRGRTIPEAHDFPFEFAGVMGAGIMVWHDIAPGYAVCALTRRRDSEDIKRLCGEVGRTVGAQYVESGDVWTRYRKGIWL